MRRLIISILRFIRDYKFEALFALLIACGLTGAILVQGSDDLHYAPAVICPMLAALLAIIYGYKKRSLHLPVNATVLLMAAFFGYVMLSTLWAVIPYAAYYFLLIFMLMPLMFAAVVCTGRAEVMLRFALAGGGLVTTVVMIAALVEFFYLKNEVVGTRVKGPFLDPNNLAAFLNMAFLPLLGLSFRPQPRLLRLLFAGLSLLFFVALLATNSRMALLGAMISFLVMMPVIIRQTRRPSVTALALLGAAAVIILLANYYSQGTVFFYLREILSFEKSVSMQERMALWLASLRIFSDHFWLGTGLASFFFFYPQYRQPDDTSDGYFTHMDPLQLGLETGIMGYVLVYAFLIAVLCRTVRVMRLPHLTGADRLLVLAPFCGLLTICIHMHMTFCLYLPANTIPVGILLAWWFVATQRFVSDPVLDLTAARGKILTGVSVVLLLWGVVWAGQATAGIYFNQKTAAATALGDFTSAENYLVWQYRVSPASNHRPYEREAELMTRRLKAARHADIATRRALVDRGLRALDGAIARQSRHGSLGNQKAILLYLAGEEIRPGAVDEAIEVLRGVLRTDPMMMDARIGLASILRERGDFAMALRVMDEGMKWPRPKGMPDVNYIGFTAQMYLLNGDRARHDQLMQFATERARLYGFEVAP